MNAITEFCIYASETVPKSIWRNKVFQRRQGETNEKYTAQLLRAKFKRVWAWAWA